MSLPELLNKISIFLLPIQTELATVCVFLSTFLSTRMRKED